MKKPPECTIFVMSGCHVCPQVVHNLKNLQHQHFISTLKIIDIEQQPELARPFNIQSVPSYILDEHLYTGLRTLGELKQLLLANDNEKIRLKIIENLSTGGLQEAQDLIEEKAAARSVMLNLLQDSETALVVRIGLTAVIEDWQGKTILQEMQPQIVAMTRHENPQIAVDACYYLALMNTPASRSELKKVSQQNRPEISEQAKQLLLEQEHQNEQEA